MAIIGTSKNMEISAMKIGGIDPGKNGACVVLDDSSNSAWQFRFKYRNDEMLVFDWCNFVRKVQPDIFVIEELSAGRGDVRSGKWAPSTMFKLGLVYGQAIAAVALTGVPYYMARPVRWQKRVCDVADVNRKGRTAKESSGDAYANLFPHAPIPVSTRNGSPCAPNHNIVDALLIATMGVLEYGNGNINPWVFE